MKFVTLVITFWSLLRVIAGKSCQPTFKLENCNPTNDGNENYQFKRYKTYKLFAKITKGCPSSQIKYNWKVVEMDSGKTFKTSSESALYIEKFTAKLGKFEIELELTEVDKSTKAAATAKTKCYIEFVPSTPLAIIRGGSTRTVRAEVGYKLDGSFSTDIDYGPGEVQKLKYSWVCVNKPEINKVLGKKSSTTVPAKYSLESDDTFELTVTTEKGLEAKTKQLVRVEKDGLIVNVECKKNCDKEGNYMSSNKMALVLKVSCNSQECKTDKENQEVEWLFVSGTAGKPLSKTHLLVMEQKVVEKEFLPGKSYDIKVQIQLGNMRGHNVVTIKMNTLKVEDSAKCTIDPTTGVSQKTKFKVSCKGFKKHVTYMVYQKSAQSEELGVLLASSFMPDINVILSSTGKDINIKITDDTNYHELETLQVDVKSDIENKKLEERKKKINDLYGGPETKNHFKLLAKSDNLDEAMQTANILVDELNSLPASEEEFKLNLRKKIVSDLEKMPVMGENEHLKMSTVTAKLIPKKGEKIDSEYKYLISKLCKKAAESQIKNGNKDNFKLTLSQQVKEANKHLMNCAESTLGIPSIDENLAAKSTTVSHNPLNVDQVATEEYQNYDEIEQTNKKSILSKAVDNAIKTIELGSQAEGRTQVAEETKTAYKTKNIGLETKVYTVGQLRRSAIKVKDSILQFQAPVFDSNVMKDYEEILYTCITFEKQNNPYKFSDSSKELATPVITVNLKKTKEDVKIEKFAKPIDIFLKLESGITPKWKPSEVVIPSNSELWIPDFLDYNMSVHRIEIPKGATLSLHIKTAKSLKMVAVPGRRPHTDDFKDAQLINGEFSKSYVPTGNFANREFWYYVAVLPDTTVSRKSRRSVLKVDYSISLESQICSYWNSEILDWKSDGCYVGISDKKDHLHCICDHISTFAGMEDHLLSKLDPITVIKYNLDLNYDYTIFLYVLAVTLLYMFMISFQSLRHSLVLKDDMVIFLSDNVRNERYAYLIIVTTGIVPFSGTTSNVTVQLFGSKGESRPHVLNYPDPERRLLQFNKEDHYVLTTKNFLGDIVRLEMWIDSVGLRPAWYCQDVQVYDMQVRKEYDFDVRQWLSVLGKGETHLMIEPSKKQVNEKSKWKAKLQEIISSGEHPWNVFHTSNEITYMQKVTVMFSSALTIGSIALISIGVPKIRLADSIGYSRFRLYAVVYYGTFLAAVFSFIIHVGIRLGFKKALAYDDKKRLNMVRIITWIATVVLIVFNLTFLLVFGYWISHVSAQLWLLITGCAVLLTLLILENVYRWIKNFTGPNIKVTITGHKDDLARVIREIEQQRMVLFQKFGDALLRPYLRFKYYPLSYQKYIHKRFKEQTRKEVGKLLREMLIFIIFCITIFYLVIAHKDNQMVYNNLTMQDMLINGRFGTSELTSVESTADLKDYLLMTIVEVVHPNHWYEGWTKFEAGIMADMSARLLGVVQLRQLRVRPNNCKVPEQMRFLNLSCEVEYSSSTDGGFIEEEHNSTSLEFYKITQKVFEKKSSNDTGSTSYLGEVGWYPGSGYVAKLGRTAANTKYVMKYLDLAHWVDYYTRVLFIEFWVYNPNHNIFTAVKIVFEKSATGAFIPTYEIRPARLIVVDISHRFGIIFCLTLFIITTTRITVYHVVKLIKNPKKYTRELWNIFDLVILALAVSCLLCYLYDYFKIGILLSKLNEVKNNEYVKYGNVFRFHRVFTIFTAVLVCLCVIRIWKFLRFGRMFRLMEHTLIGAFFPLCGLFLCHVIFLIAFSITGWLLFGDIEVFSTFKESIEAVLLMSVTFLSWSDFEDEIYFNIAYFHYMIFMYTNLAISTMYITILLFYYSESIEKFSNERGYHVKNYIKNEVKFYKNLWKVRLQKSRRLRGGTDGAEQNIVFIKKREKYVTTNEHRYAHTESISKPRFELMKALAKGVIHNRQKSIEHEIFSEIEELEVMRDITIKLIKEQNDKGEHKVVFIKYEHEHGIQFVPDEHMEQMAFIANRMLKKPSEEGEGTIKVSLVHRLRNINNQLDQINKILNNIFVVDKT